MSDGYFFSLGSTDTANAPLNLLQIDLRAESLGTLVELNWTLTGEVVEKARLLRGSNLKQLTVLKELSKVELIEGKYLDDSPLDGWNYYQISTEEVLSSVQQAFIELPAEPGVYPNVLSRDGQLNILTGFETEELLDWSIIGLSGLSIHGETKVFDGKAVISLSGLNLASGSYLLEVLLDNELKRTKFIIK